MAMEKIHADGVISQKGTLLDGVYFNLNNNDRNAVDNITKEICLYTHFFSLASNKLHYESKYELKNVNIKGKDNYPRTIAGVLHFLYYHNI